MIRKIVLAAIVAASFGSIVAPATAAVIVQVAPPPQRFEATPQPRNGYVWVEGHWNWSHNHHQWVSGTWIRARHGYSYTQPTWQERNGHWHQQPGAWSRGDRDGDGVPNNRDRSPDNPRRS
jgi:hypothetical protein